MGWKIVAAMRKNGRVVTRTGSRVYSTRHQAQNQATATAQLERMLGRSGIVFSVKEVREHNPKRRKPRKKRGPWPKGKTPPHLRKYVFR